MKYIFILVKKISRSNLYKFFLKSLEEMKSIENLRVLNIGAGGPVQGIIESSLLKIRVLNNLESSSVK